MIDLRELSNPLMPISQNFSHTPSFQQIPGMDEGGLGFGYFEPFEREEEDGKEMKDREENDIFDSDSHRYIDIFEEVTKGNFALVKRYYLRQDHRLDVTDKVADTLTSPVQ
jgi:hypothetical protein